MFKNKTNAFTLAEVLITLGIIGVVAAMTMPTLINKTKGLQYKAAFKKGLSEISQAIATNKALEGKDLSDMVHNDVIPMFRARLNLIASADYDENVQTNLSKIYNGNIPEPLDNTDFSFIQLSDGVIFVFLGLEDWNCHMENGEFDNRCFGWLDVNGAKGPNQLATEDKIGDIFYVYYYDSVVVPGDDIAKAVLYGEN